MPSLLMCLADTSRSLDLLHLRLPTRLREQIACMLGCYQDGTTFFSSGNQNYICVMILQNVSEGDTSESLDLFVHRLPPSNLGYCIWVRARNSNRASHWSRRFIFHSSAQHSTTVPPTTDFKANPFSAPFVSRCFSHRRIHNQAGGAEVGYSRRSRACAATESVPPTGALSVVEVVWLSTSPSISPSRGRKHPLPGQGRNCVAGIQVLMYEAVTSHPLWSLQERLLLIWGLSIRSLGHWCP